MKQAWKKLTRKWLYEHEGKPIQKKDIPAALNSIFKQHDFSNTIIPGFRTCGLYPFDENAPNYDKCVKKDSSILNEDLSQKLDNDDKLLHFKFFEEQIDPLVLQTFKDTYFTYYSWQGEERFSELYNLWRKIKENVSPDAHYVSLNLQEIETVDDMFIFDFPEYVTSDLSHEDASTDEKKLIYSKILSFNQLQKKAMTMRLLVVKM